MTNGQRGWPGHYLSAYGIAQKRGFRGTEREWLESLHGADVEMQVDNDLLQWKKDNEAGWNTLASFSEFKDGAVSRAEAAAREVMGQVVANANEQAGRAETAAGRADKSAGKAETAAEGAGNAARQAENQAAQARQAAATANTAAATANTAAAAANSAATTANGAANSATEAAREAGTQADYAKAQGDAAKELLGKIEETDVGGLAADILALQNGKAEKTAVETALAAKADQAVVTASLAGKVDKVPGMGLSANSYTTAEKEKLAGTGPGRRTCRFVVGTSTAGWTENDCDFLCDGVDDQVELNAAIQALPAGGGEIRILDGAYSILEPIRITKSYVTLTGNQNTVLKRVWGSTSSGGIIEVRNPFVTISDLRIDGGNNSSAPAEFVNDIGIDINSTYVTIKNCYIAYADVGIKSAQSWAKITGNTIRFCKEHGIFIYIGRAGIVEGNLCSQNDGDGIFSQGKMWTICNNQCYANGGAGIKSSDTQTVILGNSCCGNTIGIHLYGAQQCNVLGNFCALGDGLPEDYSDGFETIYMNGEEGYDSNRNLIAFNHIPGKNYVCEGGTGNEFVNNKFE